MKWTAMPGAAANRFWQRIPNRTADYVFVNKGSTTVIKRLIVAAIIFGVASAGFLPSKKSICIRSAFAASGVINENDRVVLHGNIPPKAKPEFDVGPTDPSLPMKRMILLLKIAPEKQAKLDRFVAEQHDPSSPNFHQWLTPEEFGKRFGRSQEEIATAKSWLISHGFTIDETAKSGTWINFSGTAADVNSAFHTEMHDYQVNGQLRHANSTDPSIPRALAGLVAGPVALHNFPRKAMHTPRRHMPGVEGPVAKPKPGYTEPDNGGYDLAPGDFAVIYDVNNLYNLGYNGHGVTIAVVERTIPAQGASQDAAITNAITKWNTFRSTFGLPPNPPVVTVNGTNPGDLGADEDAEADLDVEWSGAVATGATINFVTSASTNSADGVDLSAQYIVDNKLAPIMSDSFGTCESQNAKGATDNAFYNSLWEQAAVQGITVFVVTGDSGAYACTDDNGNPEGGKAVNGLASTPFNIAVGGTTLSDDPVYWNTGNSKYDVSALSYMPEVGWNEWTEQEQWTELASGGGASSIYSKPTWQVSPGVPSDGHRDMPDVSLNADVNVGYRVYTCTNENGPCRSNSFSVFGGTSAAAPSFAGIMALIVQSAGGKGQGNFNSVLYPLGNAQYSGVSGAISVFHDITSGSNGFVGHSLDLPGYSCTPYYDLVTGLGSVDAANLLLAFEDDGPLTVTISPAAALSAGAQWNVDNGVLRNSGDTVSLAFGSHTVSFNTVAGWNTPASQIVNMVNGQATSASGLYVQQTGSLTVSIVPAGVVSTGQWRVNGGAWQNSGATVSLPVGSYTLSFNTVTGWTTPGSQTVNIANGQTTSASGVYVQQTGSLTVSIVPASAVSDGATWNVDGVEPNASGPTASGLSVGSHTVNFNGIAGWKTPASQTVSISYDKTTSASGTYVLLPPTIALFSIDNGGQSTPSRTVTLNNTVTGIPADYIASESSTFAGATWRPYSTAPSFTLNAANGTKTVYLKVKNAAGVSARASTSIILAQLPVVTSFKIDAGAASTINPTVTLNNTTTISPIQYKASEDPNFTNVNWQTYSTAPKFTLSAGGATKTVYFKVMNGAGESTVVSDTIQLIAKPTVASFWINNLGDTTTTNPTVKLNNTVTNSPTQYMASQSSTFYGATWKTYSAVPSFSMSATKGTKTVYFKVRNAAGISNVMNTTITLD